jgi:hypothetical protein
MNTIKNTTDIKDRRVILSTLWIFVVFTYIYADLAPMIFNPAPLAGSTGAREGIVLGFAIFMQSAIAMVLLSRVLMHAANRWTNIMAGVLHAAIIAWTLFVSSPPTHYVFSATMVIACTLFIAWYAWTWTNSE